MTSYLIVKIGIFDELHEDQHREEAAQAGACESGSDDGRVISGERVALSVCGSTVHAGGSEEIQTADKGSSVAYAASNTDGSTERRR